jgi:hypothetical protein
MNKGLFLRIIAILSILSLVFTSCSKSDEEVEVIDTTTVYDFTVLIKMTDLSWLDKKPVGGLSFSQFVATTHASKDLMYKESDVASSLVSTIASCKDVKDVIYLASLKAEMKKLEGDSAIGMVMKSDSLKSGGSYRFTFTSTLKNRYLSLIGKIIPSPDWMLGMYNIDLNAVSVSGSLNKPNVMYVYDAGTDGGKSFTDTAAGEGVISLITTAPLATGKLVPTIGTVYIVKTIHK